MRRTPPDATTPIKVIPKPVQRFGAYQIVAPIARGGIADVFLGEHVQTGERVALKVLDPVHVQDVDIVERLLFEHRISDRVRHPGLVDVRDADRNPGNLPYIVMEYLDGENLGDLAERGLLDVGAVIAVGQQIASAVGALHAAGIVHCDLKPDNVLVLYEPSQPASRSGRIPTVKVIDYGVAHTVDSPMREDGTIAGTPPYMSPEQWRGRASLSSDVYALGCLLYELCIGDPPFSGTLPQLLVLHAEALPPRPSSRRGDLPPALDRLIVRCLAKDPALRPPMEEVEAELARLLQLVRELEHSTDLAPVTPIALAAIAG